MLIGDFCESDNISKRNDFSGIIFRSRKTITMKSRRISENFLWMVCFSASIFASGECHRITLLVVPPIADPRTNVSLLCRFDMERDSLYSVKWYKDEHEIFRYMPSQNPRQVTFPLNGIKHVGGECGTSSCSVNILATNSSATGLYRCEVSTEAPTFRIAHRNSSMIFAALPRKDPKVNGAPESARPDDEIQVNCTTDLSLPPAEIVWYINGKKVSFLFLDTASLSKPDRFGLASRSQRLQLRVQRPYFDTPDESMTLKCEAILPQWLPVSPAMLFRSTTVRVPLHPAHAQLSKFTSGSQQIRAATVLLHALASSVYLMAKFIN